MAALSTFTGVTDVEEGIPTEEIGDFVQGYAYPASVFEAVSWAKVGKGTITQRYVRWDQLDGGSGVPAGTKAESDEYTAVELTTSESSITPGFVGMVLPVSDETQMNWAIGEIQPQLIEEAVNALVDRIDSDGFSSSTAATQTVGTATQNLTVENFGAHQSAYRAFIKNTPTPMGHACCLTYDGFRDLEASMRTSGASLTAPLASSFKFDNTQGFRGEYLGFAMFEAGNMPAEGAGWSGGMTPIGRGYSGLGIVISQLPRVVPTRGYEGEKRRVTYLIIDSMHGAGLTNPNRYQEILHRT